MFLSLKKHWLWLLLLVSDFEISPFRPSRRGRINDMGTAWTPLCPRLCQLSSGNDRMLGWQTSGQKTMSIVGVSLLFGCGEKLFPTACPGRLCSRPSSHRFTLFQQRSASTFLLLKICPFDLWTLITLSVGILDPAVLRERPTWSITSTGNLGPCWLFCPIKVHFLIKLRCAPGVQLLIVIC